MNASELNVFLSKIIKEAESELLASGFERVNFNSEASSKIFALFFNEKKKSFLALKESPKFGSPIVKNQEGGDTFMVKNYRGKEFSLKYGWEFIELKYRCGVSSFKTDFKGLPVFKGYSDFLKSKKPNSCSQTNSDAWYKLSDDGKEATIFEPELDHSVDENLRELVLLDHDTYLSYNYLDYKTREHIVQVIDAKDTVKGGIYHQNVFSWAVEFKPGATWVRGGYLVFNNTEETIIINENTQTQEDWGDSRYGGHFE